MTIRAFFNRLCTASLSVFFAVATAPAVVAAQDGASGGEGAESGPLPPWAEFIQAFLELNLGEIAVWRLAVAGLLVALGISLRRFLLGWLLRPVRALLDRTETRHDDRLLEAVQRPLKWIVNLVAVYLALLVLQLPDPLMRVSSLVLQTVGTVLVAWMLNKLIDVLAAVLQDFARGTDSEIDDYLAPVIARVIRVGLFGLVFVMIVQQWGYDVTSLLAGLGIGGLAFALAAKPTLSNWFGSLMIFTDRPFTVGDRIDIDAGDGVVEEVGLRSTRIRTREDSLLTIPNADVAGKPIENLSARRRRRIQTTVGLVYETTPRQLREILEQIRALIEEHDDLSSEEAIVRFNEFGDSALEVFVDCYAELTDREGYYRVREEFLFAIADIVDEAGSSIAFPSRSLYFENDLRVDGEEG